MKKKFVILTLIALILSAIFFFVWQLPMFIDTIEVYQNQTSETLRQNMLYFIKVFGSFVSSLVITVLLAILLYFAIKVDVAELLSSTKEKRLAKKEAKRQEKLSELEAKKEELENQINSIKSNEESQK